MISQMLQSAVSFSLYTLCCVKLSPNRNKMFSDGKNNNGLASSPGSENNRNIIFFKLLTLS